MYQHILIPLENSKTDSVILEYIRPLARFTNARLTIIHVADGFMARNQKQLAESEEMRKDREYLAKIEEGLRADGFTVNTVLACGEPAEHILATAEQEQCDLIAMSTHGHRGLSDIILGSVSSEVRHRTRIPVLTVRA